MSKPKLSYRILPHAMLRHGVFPTQYLHQGIDSVRHDPFFKLGIRLASTASFEALNDDTESSEQDEDENAADQNQDNQRIESTLDNYFRRATGRPTPFGLFAAVSAVEVSEQEERAVIDTTDQWNAGLQISRSIINQLERDLLEEESVRRQAKFRFNPFLRVQGDYIIADVLKENKQEPTSQVMRWDEALQHLHSRIPRWASYQDIAEALEPLMESPEELWPYIRDLLHRDLLETNVRPPATAALPIEHLLQFASTLAQEHPTRKRIEALYEKTYKLMSLADIQGCQTHLDDLLTIETASTGTKRPKLPVHTVLYSQVHQGGLPKHFLEDLAELTLKLPQLFSSNGQQTKRQEIISEFGQHFSGAWVPIGDLIQRLAGVLDAAESKTNEPLVDGLGLSRKQRTSLSTMDITYNEIQHTVLEQMDTEDPNIDEIELDIDALEPVLESIEPTVRTPFTTTVHGAFVNHDARSRFRLTGVTWPGTLEGRFFMWDQHAKLKEQLADVYKEHGTHHNKVVAEISWGGDRRLGDLGQRTRIAEYELVLNQNSAADNAHQIPAESLLVGCHQGQILLWAPSIERFVEPVLPCAVNWKTYSSPTMRFLMYCSGYGSAWGFPKLDVIPRAYWPRVCYKSVILSPRAWSFPEKLIHLLKDRPKPKQAKQYQSWKTKFEAAFTQWKEHYRVSRWVQLAGHDATTEPADLTDPNIDTLLRDRIIDSPKHSGVLVLKETDFNPDNHESALYLKSEGPLAGEFVGHIRFEPHAKIEEPRKTRAAAKKKGTHKEETMAAENQNVASPLMMRPPKNLVAWNHPERSQQIGGDWAYSKLYSPSLVQDAWLSEAVAPFVRTLIQKDPNADVHFVRYSDESGPHLRIRFRSQHIKSIALVEEFSSQVVNHRLANTLNALTIDCYTRELERYGGVEAMPYIENIFTAETISTLYIIQCIHREEIDDVRGLWAIRSCSTLLKACDYPLEERLKLVTKIRDDWEAEYPVGKHNKKTLSDRFREHRPEIFQLLETVEGQTTDYDDEDIRAIFHTMQDKVQRAWQSIIGLEKSASLSIPKAEIIPNLLHMLCNRIFIGREREAAVHYFHQRGLESLLAKQRAMHKKKSQNKNKDKSQAA